jgi:hypothetical protein
MDGPAPPGLEGQTADGTAADIDEVDATLLKTRSSSGRLRVLCSAVIVVGIACLL